MNDQQLSTCEKNFILKCLEQKKRLDGRQFFEFRNISIQFGCELGCALVSLGETKVLAQVSCEITQPQATRPAEGILYINVNSGQIKRSTEHIVLLARNLERALKESRCVDLESLCIKAEEKVWKIRVDVNILNYEGNLTECASIAALAALGHFKRPDVTINGHEIKIHTHDERDPIPIVLHHYPVCVSFAVYEDGDIVVADPTLMEERRSDGMIVFGINSYRELCGLHFGGVTLASLEMIIKCSNQGTKRAKIVIQKIRDALEADEKRREMGEIVGFKDYLQSNTFDSFKEDRLLLRLERFHLDSTPDMEVELAEMKMAQSRIKTLGENTAVLLPAEEMSDEDDEVNANGNRWIPEFDDDISNVQISKRSAKIATKKEENASNADESKQNMSIVDLVSDSEEEDTVVLHQVT